MHGVGNWFPLADGASEPNNGELAKRVFRVGPFDIPILLKAVCHPEQIDYDEDAGVDRTGCHLWPASTVVVSLLLSYGAAQLRDTSVLELGCGTGFCGLVARRLARRVVLSDRDASARRLARRNSALQPHPVEVAAYGWERGDWWPREPGQFGLILASDVLYTDDPRYRYDPEMLQRFFAIIDWALAPHGTAIIGHVERNQRGHEDLLAAARGHFDVERLAAEACAGAALCSRAGAEGLRSVVAFCCTRRGEAPLLTCRAV